MSDASEADAPEVETKTCFVISPIGKEGSTTRKRSDKLLRYVIRAVMEPKGYVVDRADQLSEPGMITNQIVKRIVDCDILIADLSEGNPNVFYELAIRHGLKKPFVHMIDASEVIPFDNAQVRTIPVDLTDLDSVDRAKKELSTQIDSIGSGKSIAESPISIAFDLETLKASGNSDEAMLAALFTEMSSVRSELRDMRRSGSRRPTSHHPLRTEADLVQALISAGRPRLAQTVKDYVTVHTLEAQKLQFSTSLPLEEDEPLAEELREFLQSYTQRTWEVDFLPF